MKLPTFRDRGQMGFTLIELMVTIVIAAILISIAIPSYSNSIRKSHRTDAKTALLDLAQREERYLSTNSSYTNAPLNLGYGSSATFPVTVGAGYYTLSVCVTSSSSDSTCAASGSYFTLTATTTTLNNQNKDTACQTFSVTSTGTQSATDSGGVAATTCW